MKEAEKRIQDELKKGPNLSIVELIDSLIAHAYDVRASDIHIDPSEKSIVIRFRVDGVLRETHIFPRVIYDEIVCRIKVLSNLRTDEHQAPQDGRFRNTLQDNKFVDLRVSIVPTYYGENVVLRLLIDTAEQFSLESLGFLGAAQNKILKAIKKPNGMILCTGPTSSGKTTTLYTLLKMLNKNDSSIVTIEDPIEYSIQGITQIQVNPHRGLTFASGLRSILRQDPDFIMVGEIRDSETAGIAVNTALTGHLLFSTLHTNDAITTLPRLLDMGIEAYLVSSTVNLLIGQRLVRKNCKKCSKKHKFTDAELTSLAEVLPKEALIFIDTEHVGKGCEACNQTGYDGRISINEVLVVDDAIREAILQKKSAVIFKKLAVDGGMVPMIEDGCKKVASGQTTIEEILRVIHE